MKLNIKNIKTTELSSKELAQITQIFKLSFNKKVKPSSFREKYISNFFGFSFHALVKNSQDDLIGIYTFSPKVFLLEQKKINALHSLDTCFPYKGLVNPFIIKKIVKELVQFAKNNIGELSFIYGFPNSKYEKLSCYFLSWNYVLTLYSHIEIFPILRFLYFSFLKTIKYKNILKSITNQNEIKTRSNSFFHSNLNFLNKNEFTIWFTSTPFYLQIFNVNLVSNKYHNQKRNFLKELIFLSRLFIPSVSSSTNPSRGISKLLPKFNLYILLLNKDLDIRKLYFDINFLWNDVP